MTLNFAYYPLVGGENLVVPAVSANPGNARFTRNYELDRYGRYRRIDGYERFDGRPKPSEASYWILNFTAGSAAMSAGDTVTGASSGHTGALLYQVLTTGSYAGGNAAGYLVLTNATGVFTNGENLQVSSVTEAAASGTAVEGGAATDDLHTTYLRAAIEYARSQIAAVPGSGNILGVWQYNGVKYAFRNNAAGTAAVMHKSTATGWTACNLGETLAFGSGSAEIVESEVISQGDVLATVRRVVLLSGAWANSDAAGYLVIYGRSGGDFASGAISGSITGAASATGVQIANAFAPGGRFECVNHNFGGHVGTYRMYGVDGKSRGFEWDGNYLCPIITGMTVDTPEHVFPWKGHLFFTFAGGSVQHSSLNDPPKVVAPYIWDVITGAGELGIGDEVTGLAPVKDILAVKARNSTWMLYGSAAAGGDSWALKPYDAKAGAIEWSMQSVEGVLFSMDDRGITALLASDQYGDFQSSTVSGDIQPFIDAKLTDVVCAMSVKAKNQYRVFYSDGQATYMTFYQGKVIGFTRVLLPDAPTCMCSGENSDGVEELFFGDAGGYVYQMDKGTSFDGAAVEAFVRTHYNHLKTPEQKKRIRKLKLELDAPSAFELKVRVEYDYAASAPSSMQDFDVSSIGGVWEVSEWESFEWDGQEVGTAEVYVDGTGKNFGLLLYSSSVYDEPHTLQGVTVHYSPRGISR